MQQPNASTLKFKNSLISKRKTLLNSKIVNRYKFTHSYACGKKKLWWKGSSRKVIFGPLLLLSAPCLSLGYDL